MDVEERKKGKMKKEGVEYSGVVKKREGKNFVHRVRGVHDDILSG